MNKKRKEIEKNPKMVYKYLMNDVSSYASHKGIILFLTQHFESDSYRIERGD